VSQLTALWRRLDTPGHDACRLDRTADGWLLAGTAVFRHDGAPARLDYELACDEAWRSRRGAVRGWLGARRVDRVMERSDTGGWTLDGAAAPGLEALVDLDFGFTPATNLPQLRRVALGVGDAADVTVAWFDVDEPALRVLPQRYERRSVEGYWYESPTSSYAALLEVTPGGFVRVYPDLWEEER
jgi:hypothetical protein